jgi:uncharacterized protein (DUF1778 family)
MEPDEKEWPPNPEIVVSAEVFDRLLAELNEPPKVSPKLAAAIKKSRERREE